MHATEAVELKGADVASTSRPVRTRTRTRDEVNKEDIDKEIDLEKADNTGDVSAGTSPSGSLIQLDTNGVNVLSFGHNDPANPYTWSTTKKIFIVFSGIILVVNSTLGSAITGGISTQLSDYFGITNQAQLVLPTSIYLLGYVLGPLIFSPLSETYGRKIIMISTFTLYTAFSVGCALAPTWAGLIIMRLLTGVGASTPISVVGGIYADIFSTHKARGRAMAMFMAATTWGPLIGPVISGFIGVVSWRWAFGIQCIFTGITWPLLLAIPETYAPIILRRKARKLRKQEGKADVYAPIELEKQDLREIIVVVLTRPIRMFLFEALVLCSCLYLSLLYAIFYMFLQAFPIIYEGVYGFNAGEEGLAFIPIGIGSIIALCIYLTWDHYMDKQRTRDPPPAWTQVEEYRRVTIACIGAPLLIISMFWLGWTARQSIHWIVPILAAIPFGVSYLLIFMSLINYIVDAYEVFSASAMAAASCSRSLFAVVLPFAATPMYTRLGIAWACSLLGFIALAMGVIPFMFIKYGTKIRANSKFCQELARKKQEKEAKEQRRQARARGEFREDE